jgi:hypothetical protein
LGRLAMNVFFRSKVCGQVLLRVADDLLGSAEVTQHHRQSKSATRGVKPPTLFIFC